MQRSLVYGDQVCFWQLFIDEQISLHKNQVTQLLNGSPIWKDYEQQKHDLFLDNEKPLALTQVRIHCVCRGFNFLFQSSTVGYLTMSKSALPSVPPPIEDNQDNSEGLLG